MTSCDQLLEPSTPPTWGIGATNAPSVVESGYTPLLPEAGAAAIDFTVVKLSSIYTFVELSVENPIDDSPFVIVPMVISRRVDGFTVLLDGLPDNSNYRLRWTVVVTQL